MVLGIFVFGKWEGDGNGDEQNDRYVQAPIGQGKTPNFAISCNSFQK